MTVGLKEIANILTNTDELYKIHRNRKNEIDFIQYPLTKDYSIHYEITSNKVYLDFEYETKYLNKKATEFIKISDDDKHFKLSRKRHKRWLRIEFKNDEGLIDFSTEKASIKSIKKYIKQFKNSFESKIVFIYDADELLQKKYTEGTMLVSLHSRYERNQEARKKCLEEKGYRCAVCDLNFEEKYGDLGKNFIHVHHIKPLSTIKEEYEIDPIRDLIPVCPNCHAMLHKKKDDGENFTVEQLKEIVKENCGGILK